MCVRWLACVRARVCESTPLFSQRSCGEQVAVLQRQLAARDAGAAPPTPARGEWAGRSEGELEQALEGASAALSAAQEEADRQEAAAAELERQREELDVELGARQREYEEMEARLRELQAAAMQGQL